jgi:hypothetical protein
MSAHINTTDAIALLRRIDACDGPGEAMPWVEAHAHLSPEQLWHACPRGDWLLWFVAQIDLDRRYVVAAACACAQGTLHLVPAGEDRPRIAVDTAIRWTQGQATLEEVRSAARAAAAYASYTAAYAAARAAYASTSAAAYASDAAAYASDAADAFSVRRQQAERVRSVIPWRMVAARLGAA